MKKLTLSTSSSHETFGLGLPEKVHDNSTDFPSTPYKTDPVSGSLTFGAS
jgi:hypothetical protein